MRFGKVTRAVKGGKGNAIKRWVIIPSRPERTIGAARSLIYNAAYSLGLEGEARSELRGDEVLGYIPTIVDSDWEKELPETWG